MLAFDDLLLKSTVLFLLYGDFETEGSIRVL